MRARARACVYGYAEELDIMLTCAPIDVNITYEREGMAPIHAAVNKSAAGVLRYSSTRTR
eukprot:COSAG01_NODE_14045_length_1503_cov_1.302707_3_plen_59_part_01